MTTKLSWRLSKLPTVSELTELIEKKVITQEEAKEILFNADIEIEREKKDLESEVKFLRELVAKLANQQTTRIIETIREVEAPWRRHPWYRPYDIWCTATSGSLTITNGAGSTNNVSNAQSFADIVTF